MGIQVRDLFIKGINAINGGLGIPWMDPKYPFSDPFWDLQMTRFGTLNPGIWDLFRGSGPLNDPIWDP